MQRGAGAGEDFMPMPIVGSSAAPLPSNFELAAGDRPSSDAFSAAGHLRAMLYSRLLGGTSGLGRITAVRLSHAIASAGEPL